MEAGSSFPRMRKVPPEVHPEECCDVYLCITPLLWSFSFFASSSGSSCGESWCKHWLLAFDYGGDKVLICDAAKDSGGELTGRKSWKKRAAFYKSDPKKRYLGKYYIPERVLDKIMESCDSGPYDLTRNNCQTWVLKLLRRLGIQQPVEQDHAEKVVNEVIAPGAVIASGYVQMVAGHINFAVGILTGAVPLALVGLGGLVSGGSAVIYGQNQRRKYRTQPR